LKKAILIDVNRLAAENKLSGLEKIKKIHLIVDPFTIENDILTPKMSLKRHIARKVFEQQIKALYAEPENS
jgi:long-chain acyl-CoA synthetase